MRVILDFAKRRFRKKKKRKGRKETRNFKSYRRIALMKINSNQFLEMFLISFRSSRSPFGREEGKEERKKERKKKNEKGKKIGIVWKTRASKVPVGVVGLLMQ